MSTTPADENPLPADNPDEHEVLDLDSAEADGGQDESAEERDQSEGVEPSLESLLADARQQLQGGRRGPVGVEQLTSFKYVVRGNGQCRP